MIPDGSRICESGWMRKGVEVRLGAGDRDRLEAVIGSGNSPQKHVWRARIVLLSADGVGTMAIQRQTGKAKPTIWRWQARFMAEGVDGLLHESTRPAGKPALSPQDRKSTRLNSSHVEISYAVFCLKKKKKNNLPPYDNPIQKTKRK